MGQFFQHWQPRSPITPENYQALSKLLQENREFSQLEQLSYGDHGLEDAKTAVLKAIKSNKRIALYADYDVDGTMSCVSWIWFFNAIGFNNYVHYIPCRFKEGYGVNLKAVAYLVEAQKADVIITMDTGITANEEAAYCKEKGIEFICTDHHKVQPEKMPDCIILNPKSHPDPEYQELCGCGITFVLLRQLAEHFEVGKDTWTDLLALAGMATICDVVPLNSVNHKLAQLGVSALMRSKRPIIAQLREAASLQTGMDEKDVGFRLGPRINAVGRLGHADQVVSAFVEEEPGLLIEHMNACNNERRSIQAKIVKEATALAQVQSDSPILFLGGPWHPGVVGIAASKIAEKFWKPVWLYEKKEGKAKGSARSIAGFDVTEAMQSAGDLFLKFGGHKAAGGFNFDLENEKAIYEALLKYAKSQQEKTPDLWESRIDYDCDLELKLAELPLAETMENLKPFGHGFEEPRFVLRANVHSVQHYKDKQTGAPKHTAVLVRRPNASTQKLMFFNEVVEDLAPGRQARFLISASKNTFRGQTSLSLIAYDYELELPANSDN